MGAIVGSGVARLTIYCRSWVIFRSLQIYVRPPSKGFTFSDRANLSQLSRLHAKISMSEMLRRSSSVHLKLHTNLGSLRLVLFPGVLYKYLQVSSFKLSLAKVWKTNKLRLGHTEKDRISWQGSFSPGDNYEWWQMPVQSKYLLSG